MKNNLQFSKSIAIMALVLYSFGTLSAKDVFIKPNASGTGADWSTAANVSYLGGSSIADGDVIHIAAGEYLRSTQLSISKYVTVLGGYSASSTGTDLSLRDITVNKTVFKPDVTATSRAININAITASGGNKITLDGLYFEGFSNVSQGAALIITTAQGDLDFKNLTFTNNQVANSLGGALALPTAFLYDITITMDGCTFEGNQATWTTGSGYGGAFYINNSTVHKTINIKNSVFKNNIAYSRGAVGYFGSNMTVNISDCLFDSNQCTVSTDNTSNGGCFYIVGLANYASTFNVSRSIFLNSYITGKGSVIWFNNVTGSLINNLNMTNCSLIGNYSSRTTSGRAAIDVDNYTSQMQFALNGCVLSNYNNSGTTKKTRYADVMFVALASTSNTSTFTNTIANGTHFVTSNALAAITPPDTLYNKLHGYLADSTINLAFSGDLKITDKIVFKKIFTAANLGTYFHAQIFDVKAKMNFPMTLIATIPTGYTLTVDGTDYSSGVATINIAAAATDPVITLKNSTAVISVNELNAEITTRNGIIRITGIESGYKITAFNLSGQQFLNKTSTSDNLSFAAKGFVMVKVSSNGATKCYKLLSE